MKSMVNLHNSCNEGVDASDDLLPTATGPTEIPRVPPPAPPPQRHAFEMQVHSNSGRGDVATKKKMVICDSSHMSPAQMKLIGKVVRCTDILGTPIPELLNEESKSIDTGQIIILQKLQVRNNDINATMVSWRQLVIS